MKQYGMSMFADRFAKMAADSDYSRHGGLQEVSQCDIRAAAEALWWNAARKGLDRDELYRGLAEADVISAMLAQVEHYMDDNHLVSVNFEGYWDMTDNMIESPGLRQQIEEHLSQNWLRDKKAEGCTVVSNRYGIWLFRFEQ